MKEKDCPACGGKGKREVVEKDTEKKYTIPCEVCNGHGKIKVFQRGKR